MGASLFDRADSCHAGSVPITERRFRPRNDIGQYDDLADEWWRPDGVFCMLHWLAEARASLIPPATRAGAVLVDLGCGAGLLAPHVAGKGYRHIGVDLTASALAQAAAHGVIAVRGDVTRVPLRDGCADVVSAGEILEHVVDAPAAIAEACRLLRPDGLLVVDTINATALARLIAVRIGERFAGGAPKGIHDPNLFVPPAVLVSECARAGVVMHVRGIRPALSQMLRWLVTRRGAVRIVPTRSAAVLYQAWGNRSMASPQDSQDADE
jgi:2-polyprenyl-6-hydroxyphenyl methylase/3-demethylubiquinone-9 3-methyltransferase